MSALCVGLALTAFACAAFVGGVTGFVLAVLGGGLCGVATVQYCAMLRHQPESAAESVIQVPEDYHELKNKAQVLDEFSSQAVPMFSSQVETVRTQANAEVNTLTESFSSIAEILNEAQKSTRKSMESINVYGETTEAQRISMEARSQGIIEAFDGVNSRVDDIVKQPSHIPDLVADLAAYSKEIYKMASEVSNVAKQTNLISLNASIEAARAGEVGRGFAVVANEVRHLADASSKTSNQIIQSAHNIDEIVNKTAKVIEQEVAETQVMLQSVKQQLEHLAKDFNYVMNIFCHSTSDLSALNESTLHHVYVALEAFQYEDRTNQILANITKNLCVFQQMVQDGYWENDADAHLDDWLREVERNFTTHEERQALREIKGQTDDDEAAGGEVFLF